MSWVTKFDWTFPGGTVRKDTIMDTSSRNLVATETSIYFSSSWDNTADNSSVFVHDLLNKITKPVAMDTVRPGQMVVVDPGSLQSTPGMCL